MSEKTINVSHLTPNQQGFYFSLLNFYTAEEAYNIVNALAERGRNSYLGLMNKLGVFNKGLSKKEEDYYNALYAEFDLNATVTTNDIIHKVTKVRHNLEMDLYTSKLKIKCEADFYAIYAVQEITELVEVNGKRIEQIVGYIPLAKVKPENQEKKA